MKKALVILMALAMIFCAFADADAADQAKMEAAWVAAKNAAAKAAFAEYAKAAVASQFDVDLSMNKDNTAMSYAVKLSTDEVIANTTLFAEYDGRNASVFGEDTNGAITLGAKISF